MNSGLLVKDRFSQYDTMRTPIKIDSARTRHLDTDSGVKYEDMTQAVRAEGQRTHLQVRQSDWACFSLQRWKEYWDQVFE